MRHKPRRFTAALLVFSLFFQLLPFPAFASAGKRNPLPVSEPAPAWYASLNANNASRPVHAAVAAPSATAELTAPSDMAVVTAPTEIIGSAAGDGMTKYTLAYAPVQMRNPNDPEYAPVTYTVFASGTQPVNGGVLGVFDPTLLTNGHYILRLTVEAGDTSAEKEITVSVEGELKAGSFSMSFVDMDLPIHGLPLSVIRTYDSREKDAIGRFGYGWDMKLSRAMLSENGTPGKNWKMVQSGGGWLKSYRLVEEKPHEVVVHWGNGKTDKFALKFEPSRSFFPIRWVQARYESTNGSKSKLEPLIQSDYLLYQNEAVLDFNLDFQPFNPKHYKLTTVDGSVYILNDQTGLEKVTSANGDVVTITADGVTHSEVHRFRVGR